MAVWAKILTSLRDHPKAIEAGPQAMWLYVSMILYCKERDTFGHVPASFVSPSCHGRAPMKAASRLVRVGLLHETADGFEVVGYEEKQGETASISAMRAKKAAQKRKERADKKANVASDTPEPVARLEQSRAEQSRREHIDREISISRLSSTSGDDAW